MHLDADAVELGVDGDRPVGAAFAIAAAMSGALDASIGSTGRPTVSLNSSSASAPPVSAATHDGHGGARHHRRAAYDGDGEPAAAATAS